MNEPSPQTRALLDDLRAIDEPTPTQIDHAWRRFAHRQQRRRRHTAALWFGLTAAAVATAVLLVPSLRFTALGRGDDPSYHEAVQQAIRQLDDRRVERQTQAASAGGTSSASPASPESSALPEASVVPPEPPGGSEPEGSVTSPAASEPHARPRPKDGAPASESLAKPTPTMPSAAASVAAPVAAEPTPTIPTAASIAAELSLLDEAERALREGRLDRVERLLADHRERFPAGTLVEERRTLVEQLRLRRDARPTTREN